MRKTRYVYLDKLKNIPCVDCGHRFPPVCMDFDHLPGTKKILSLSEMATLGRPLKEIDREVAKCEVVCACCHRIRTLKRKKAAQRKKK